MSELPAMKVARAVVEAHIEAYGMVPHPDKLKEAIAELMTTGIFRGTVGGQAGYWSAPRMRREARRIGVYSSKHEFVPSKHHHFCDQCGYSRHEPLKHPQPERTA